MIKEKKPFIIILQAVLFFLFWVILLDKLPIPSSEDAAMERFITELSSLLVVLALTIIFNRIVEKPPLSIINFKALPKHAVAGLFLGAFWIGSALILIYLLQAMRFEPTGGLSQPGIWVLALLINAATLEFLFRGYIYQMLKRYMGMSVAWVLTSFFFTALHTSAFLEGLLAVFNVFTLSLLLTALVEYTESVITSICAHFVWLTVGGIGFGAVRLSPDFPAFYHAVSLNNEYLSGGAFKLNGSVIMLIVNIVLLFLITHQLRKRPKDVHAVDIFKV